MNDIESILVTLKAGLTEVKHDKKKAVLIIAMMCALLMITEIGMKISAGTVAGAIYRQMILPVIWIVIPITTLYLMGTSLRVIGMRSKLERIGINNKNGIIPRLVKCEPKGNKVYDYYFASEGIPLEAWKDKSDDLEASLNIYICDMRYIEGRKYILITASHATGGLPDSVVWNDALLDPDDFKLVLGEGERGRVTVDLNEQNSILIGGSTGSGKSVLLRLLMYQAKLKGAEVYIADYKGMIDYTSAWESILNVCTPETLQNNLDELIELLDRRKKVLKQADIKNISEYRQKIGPMKRHIFVVDEVAELLDKTGASKERKAEIDMTIAKLSTLARQGRAFGIHLILATQRPDANILPGQIKNNVDCRICGRADNVLSQIILDSTDAAEKIGKNCRGRFLTNSGELFQSYWIDDDVIENHKGESYDRKE
ncbi:MAG: DUF87 domain-containing protein [Solobacterium sp.]|jgi:S-DNA-T family DNA segregation ATPase FtsK/SpoIIIE|nr:DUF87 domain-containing protein [Solobacterium sp.]MCH4049332.1 DUF87 domain-containing protein [Solobacterium sp.]MCH4075188.1 DUF87 domain-containing protein [Solobacterium sp.]MCI1313333.1 DUF87 domain-containing protein [Solobacterium sp.]MCI1345584.1 DUF87 domain-containing protein [Solobacterium sp.]